MSGKVRTSRGAGASKRQSGRVRPTRDAQRASDVSARRDDPEEQRSFAPPRSEFEVLGTYEEWLSQRSQYDLHVRVPDDAMSPALQRADVVGVNRHHPDSGEPTSFRFKEERRLQFGYYHGEWLDLGDGTSVPVSGVIVIGVAIAVVGRALR